MLKKIINVVEDEKDLNELVKSYLVKEGYEVYSYYTYDDAYKAIDRPCDLWILDIMLDDKSGFDLIEEIKSRNPSIPVVFTRNLTVSLVLKKVLMIILPNHSLQRN